jgi:cytochrome c oxidase cbb3-type subunit 3
MVGPNLTDNFWIHGSSDSAIFTTIFNGVAPTMTAFGKQLDKTKIECLASYVISIIGSKPANAKAPQGNKSERI